MAKRRLVQEEVEETDEQQWQPIHKTIDDPKPAKGARKLFDSPVKTSRPVSVYKERVVDSDSGKADWYLWYTTEDSQTLGKDVIVKVIENQQREIPIGEDFTIPYSPAEVKKIRDMSFGKTKFYVKDGEDTRSMDTEELLKENF